MQGNKGVLVGVGVSMAVHILLLLAYRNSGPGLPPVELEAPASMTVRIIAPAPPPEPPRVQAAAPQRSGAAARRGTRKTTPAPVIAVPASPQREEAPDAFTVQQAEEPAPVPGDAPRFNMNSARQTARQLAGQTKLGREGQANAQFPDPPLETESPLGKAIGKAKRRNCKDGIPGGLLAPLLLAMDKKDHGCKW
ncbi:hypothetical protein MasN3_01780 [Massilia varians]|uniref:Energy transducer TonB n=2 Tax=Massilia varians TaxID=457921 RepID=A0ABM8C0J1_9BURK|nr:hypothetical protein MasN3_01780 [Massilia varians]